MAAQIDALQTDGFAVVPGPFCAAELAVVADAYGHAVALAVSAHLHRRSTSLRVGGLINADPCFEQVFTHALLLSAASEVVGQAFKLSAFHARTVLPHPGEQSLHQDFPRL